jgi:hypothetical protein
LAWARVVSNSVLHVAHVRFFSRRRSRRLRCAQRSEQVNSYLRRSRCHWTRIAKPQPLQVRASVASACSLWVTHAAHTGTVSGRVRPPLPGQMILSLAMNAVALASNGSWQRVQCPASLKYERCSFIRCEYRNDSGLALAAKDESARLRCDFQYLRQNPRPVLGRPNSLYPKTWDTRLPKTL